MTRCHPQKPAKRTQEAWAEAIDGLNASDAVKDSAACVVWWDMMSLGDMGLTPDSIMVRVRRETQDVTHDELCKALIDLGYCEEEARYRAFEVDAYYRDDEKPQHVKPPH